MQAKPDTWDIDARFYGDILPGEALVITCALPWKWLAFGPRSFMFGEPDHWAIEDVLLFITPENAVSLLSRRTSARELEEVRADYQVVQRRQVFGFRAVPQVAYTRFRCVVHGTSVEATLTDIAVGELGDSDVVVRKARDCDCSVR